MTKSINTIRSAITAVIVSSALIGTLYAETPVKLSTSKDSVSSKTVVKKLKPQTTCPVYGGDIDKTQYVDVNGKRIYVCCPACIADVKKDPDKYIKKLESLGQSVESITQNTDKKDTTVKDSQPPAMMDHSKMKH